MALVKQGLEEPIIARVVESRHATDGNNLGPGDKEATYWTTTFTQIEYCDHDAQLICEAVGKPHDPDSDYTLMLIDQQAASEELEMVSFKKACSTGLKSRRSVSGGVRFRGVLKGGAV